MTNTLFLYALLISCILSVTYPALMFGEADEEQEGAFTQRVSNLIRTMHPDLDVAVIFWPVSSIAVNRIL